MKFSGGGSSAVTTAAVTRAAVTARNFMASDRWGGVVWKDECRCTRVEMPGIYTKTVSLWTLACST